MLMRKCANRLIREAPSNFPSKGGLLPCGQLGCGIATCTNANQTPTHPSFGGPLGRSCSELLHCVENNVTAHLQMHQRQTPPLKEAGGYSFQKRLGKVANFLLEENQIILRRKSNFSLKKIYFLLDGSLRASGRKNSSLVMKFYTSFNPFQKGEISPSIPRRRKVFFLWAIGMRSFQLVTMNNEQ